MTLEVRHPGPAGMVDRMGEMMSRTRTESVVVSAQPRKLFGYGGRYHAWRIRRRLRKRWLSDPTDRLPGPTPPG